MAGWHVTGWHVTSGLGYVGHNHSFLTEMLVSTSDSPRCLSSVLPSYPPTTHCLTKALAKKYEESGIQDEGRVYKMPSCGQMWSLVTVLENYS